MERDHKVREVQRSPRRVVPRQVKEAGTKTQRRLESVPGASKALAGAADGYTKAIGGLGRVTSRVSNITLSEGRIIKAYRRRGTTVNELEDIRSLDLKVVDRVRPKRLDLWYAAVAGVEGAGAGFLISGGEAFAAAGSVAGAGAGAAPGAGTVIGAMAADTAFVLAAASRGVAHVAAYHGYDPEDPSERIYMMSIINLGSAVTAGAKVSAYQELSTLTQLLARRAVWERLNQQLLTQIAQKFAAKFGVRLTQRKLGQLVPIAGILVGGGVNVWLLDHIMDAAYWTYRERFLEEKRGGEPFFVPAPPEAGLVTDEREEAIDLLDTLRSEGLDPAT